MYYPNFLLLHSYFRWVAIIALIYQMIWIYLGHRNQKPFTKSDQGILIILCMIFNIQLLLGWMLYLQSPLVAYFFKEIPKSIKLREVRFFGLEHVTMMSISIVWMNICSFQIKKHIDSKKGFSFLWKRYIWIGLFILASIPWSFSPLTSRPNWR